MITYQITYQSVNNTMLAGRKIWIILANEKCGAKPGTTHINPSYTEVSSPNVRPDIARSAKMYSVL
jgi:hypothetical protein